MSKDHSQLESELKALRAQPLDPALLDRLDACADDTWTEISDYERHIEKALQHHRPAALPEALMDSLLAVTKDTPFTSATDTIVSFPAKTQDHRPSKSPWAAAAAVAIIGAISALFIPMNSGKQVADADPKPSSPSIISNAHGALVPAEFSRNFTEATDQGIVWQDENQAHRVVKVVYHDRVTMTDTDGKTYQVEQPRIEYYMIPTESD